MAVFVQAVVSVEGGGHARVETGADFAEQGPVVGLVAGDDACVGVIVGDMHWCILHR